MADTAAVLSLDGLLRAAGADLRAAGIADATLEARLIVEHVTGADRIDIIREPGRVVEDPARQAVFAALARRKAGEPVHRILGHRDFFGLRLALSPQTLEPRPDTETLVELVLPHARRFAEETGACRILDMGTGTGAIALALLSNVPQATAWGVDVSANALETAARNGDIPEVGNRFTTVRSDWFSGVEGRFHIIVSNPPYIRTGDLKTLQDEVRNFDPVLALDGGADGCEAYRVLARQAARHLEDDGVVGVEIGAGQREDVAAIFGKADFRLADEAHDLGGLDRALLFAGPAN